MGQHDDKAFACVRIRSATVPHAEITRRLAREPTGCHAAGDLMSRHSDRRHEHHEWRLESVTFVASDDAARHLDWMLDLLESVQPELARLQRDGATVQLVTNWGWSGPFAQWQGGGRKRRKKPSAAQQRRIGALELDEYGDTYCLDAD